MADLVKDLTETVFDNYTTTLGESQDKVVVGNEKVVFAELSVDDKVVEYVEPTIRFTKWLEEESLTLSYPTPTGMTDKTLIDGEGVRLYGGAEDFYFKQYDDNTFKFGLVLNSIPDKSKVVSIDGVEKYQWVFQLLGADRLVQIKRPPLIKDNGNGTKTFDSFGGEGEHENSQKFYRTVSTTETIYNQETTVTRLEHGFSFLRPRFIDAKENVIWADLEIQGTNYIVTVDKKWIDEAVYPIKANDTVTYQEGTDSYTGCLDTMGQEYRPNTNLGTLATMQATWWADTDRSNTFIKWDLSALAGSTVSAVSIALLQNSGSPGNTVSVYRLLRNWVVGQATWNIYSTGNSWSTAGGAYNDADRSSTLSVSLATDNGTGTWQTWLTTAQLVTDVQNFIDGTYSNYGWVFTCNDVGDFHEHTFASSEDTTAAERPKITITYTPSAGGAVPIYTKEILASLPANAANLATEFTEQEYTNVLTDDGSYVVLE